MYVINSHPSITSRFTPRTATHTFADRSDQQLGITRKGSWWLESFQDKLTCVTEEYPRLHSTEWKDLKVDCQFYDLHFCILYFVIFIDRWMVALAYIIGRGYHDNTSSFIMIIFIIL